MVRISTMLGIMRHLALASSASISEDYLLSTPVPPAATPEPSFTVEYPITDISIYSL